MSADDKNNGGWCAGCLDAETVIATQQQKIASLEASLAEKEKEVERWSCDLRTTAAAYAEATASLAKYAGEAEALTASLAQERQEHERLRSERESLFEHLQDHRVFGLDLSQHSLTWVQKLADIHIGQIRTAVATAQRLTTENAAQRQENEKLRQARERVSDLVYRLQCELHINDGRRWTNPGPHLEACVDCKWRMRIITALASPAVPQKENME